MHQPKRTYNKWTVFLSMCLLLLNLLSESYGFSPYSNDELDQLEKEFIAQINHSNQVIHDPLSNQYLAQLGMKLAAQSDVMPKPHFFLVNSDEINAFAGPGGHIGIHSKLFIISEHESELAAVMAHEIAHVRQNHLYHMLEHHHHMQVPMLASMLASIALGVINPALGQGALMATLGGFAQDNINFIRSNEKEADRIGIDMLKRAGFNPHGMVQFFKRMQESTRYYSAKVPEILRTHPLDDSRMAEAQNRIQVPASTPFVDSLGYLLTKERIRNNTQTNKRTLLMAYNARCEQAESTDDACLYGKALALISLNQLKSAHTILSTLSSSDPNNLFYAIPLSELDSKLGQHDLAIHRLKGLLENHPEHFALMMALSKAYSDAGQKEPHAYALLQAHRAFPRNLQICHQLARAYANIDKKAYAYFTLAECHLQEANKKEAKRFFKMAHELAQKDKFLKARIKAKLKEV